MLKLIIGKKGSGKTKTLIEMVNGAIEKSNGSVICLEKGDKLKYDVSYRCRLIDTDEYKVESAASLYGFVAGLLASNHDITDLFIDSALKICGNDVAMFEQMVNELNDLLAKVEVNGVFTSSIAAEDLPESLKAYL